MNYIDQHWNIIKAFCVAMPLLGFASGIFGSMFYDWVKRRNPKPVDNSTPYDRIGRSMKDECGYHIFFTDDTSLVVSLRENHGDKDEVMDMLQSWVDVHTINGTKTVVRYVKQK